MFRQILSVVLLLAAYLAYRGTVADHEKIPSATPVTYGDLLYVPYWDGHLECVRRNTFRTVWSVDLRAIVSEFMMVPRTGSITAATATVSPTVSGDTVYVGTDLGCVLVALDRYTGAVKWRNQVHDEENARISVPPVVVDDYVVVFASSARYGDNVVDMVVEYNWTTGRKVWKNVVTDADAKPVQGSIPWGSRPAIAI